MIREYNDDSNDALESINMQRERLSKAYTENNEY